jgi:uncharacterized membrane protein (DUF373 family)
LPTAGEANSDQVGREGVPCRVPHTQVHTVVRRALENLQDGVVLLLLVLLLVLSLQALWRLGHMALIDAAPTTELLSEVVYVLILTELYRLLIVYLREHRISVALAVEVALVSTLREIMLKGAHEFEWLRLLGLSLLLVVLGGLLALARWLGALAQRRVRNRFPLTSFRPTNAQVTRTGGGRATALPFQDAANRAGAVPSLLVLQARRPPGQTVTPAWDTDIVSGASTYAAVRADMPLPVVRTAVLTAKSVVEMN